MLQLTTVGAPGGPFLQWLVRSALTFTVVNVAALPFAVANPVRSAPSIRATPERTTPSFLIPLPLAISSCLSRPRDSQRKIACRRVAQLWVEAISGLISVEVREAGIRLRQRRRELRTRHQRSRGAPLARDRRPRWAKRTAASSPVRDESEPPTRGRNQL